MKTKIEDCYIKFLPSEEGNGYTGTIRKDLGLTEKGWANWYGHCKGIAKDFEPETDWQAIVKFRLQKQGVKFQ